jgi:ATP-dependent Lon protease
MEEVGGNDDERTEKLLGLILGRRAEADEPLNLAERQVAHWIAREMAERRLDKLVEEELAKNQRQVYEEIRLDLLKHKAGPDNAASLEKLAHLVRQNDVRISAGIEAARPTRFEDIVGQDTGIRALTAALNTPYPQHILIYGPPGIGKTSAARLALNMARASRYSPFAEDAPFIEADATTMRFDPREGTNPLIGSVHDPIYQGANRDLASSGVPEPKLGLVSRAHGGVLFIDEIGELDGNMQGKLLKVLEDKRVFFQSSYFDEQAPMPEYVRELFKRGAPADFILIGATTRSPQEISPALRSRCVEVFFSPLGVADLVKVTCGAAKRMNIPVSHPAAKLIADLCEDGRSCVKLLSLSHGRALSMGCDVIGVRAVRGAAEGMNMHVPEMPISPPRVGSAMCMGLSGHKGVVFRMEAALRNGYGTVCVNHACANGAQDAASVAMIAVSRAFGIDIDNVDVTVNLQFSENVDGSSLGLAIAMCIYSLLTDRPLRQDVALTGEVSLMGELIGAQGLKEKFEAAKRANLNPVGPDGDVQNLRDVAKILMV